MPTDWTPTQHLCTCPETRFLEEGQAGAPVFLGKCPGPSTAVSPGPLGILGLEAQNRSQTPQGPKVHSDAWGTLALMTRPRKMLLSSLTAAWAELCAANST